MGGGRDEVHRLDDLVLINHGKKKGGSHGQKGLHKG